MPHRSTSALKPAGAAAAAEDVASPAGPALGAPGPSMTLVAVVSREGPAAAAAAPLRAGCGLPASSVKTCARMASSSVAPCMKSDRRYCTSTLSLRPWKRAKRSSYCSVGSCSEE